MKRSFLCFYLLPLFVLIALTSSSQNTITGTVADNVGSSLVGATIKINNSTSGTVTDNNGRFVLTDANLFHGILPLVTLTMLKKKLQLQEQAIMISP